ncbi:MAG: SGNH/GDSL hydrolase family protein [Lacibacter sp.]
MFKNFKALMFGLFVALLLCEIILRIYNPFSNFSKHGKLILPANQKTVFENKWIKQLDPQIHYSRNSLGFRGPEPADSISKLNSIICIGGSTTECRFLSDSTTWPFLLGEKLKDSVPNVWVNNAGIDGHSTFGHLLLLKEYIIKLRPKYILLLTGVNDVETNKPESFDLMNENKIHFTSAKQFFKSALNKTETGSTIFQLYAIKAAYKKGLIHKDVDFKHLPDTTLPYTYIQNQLAIQKAFVESYGNRLQEIITLCKTNSITPVLLTQPSLYGSFTDPATGINMGTRYIATGGHVRNNILQQNILEEYNNKVRSFSDQATVIDLAALMPKNSAYFYDFIHYNKAGAVIVANIVSIELKKRFISK